MHAFKDPSTMTRVAVIAVGLYLAIDLLLGGAILYSLVEPPFPGSTSAVVIAVVALFNFFALLACIVIVGMWIYRVSANAHAISDEMTISPGWAVGWYFVPIMNLVKPFQGMKEAWLASHYRGNWHGEPTPGLLIWWWALWLITNILGNISFQITIRDSTGEMAQTASYIDLAAALLNLPLCLILIGMMRRLCRAQLHARHDETFA